MEYHSRVKTYGETEQIPSQQNYHLYSYSSRLTQEFIRLLNIDIQGACYNYDASPYPRYNPKDVLVCSLKTFALADEPLYDALSYTWGNPLDVFESKYESDLSKEVYKKTLPIICDGDLIFVGANLHDAMLSLRRARRIGHDADWERMSGHKIHDLIWVDALCINQKDIDERNEQVSIMDSIYRHSQSVFIWLGKEDVFVQPAIDVLQTLDKLPLDDALSYRTRKSLDKVDYASLNIANISQRQWCCVYAFLARTWFRRAWIVQEVALAPYPVVMAGNNMVTWKTIVGGALFLEFSRWYFGMISAARSAMDNNSAGSAATNLQASQFSIYQLSEETEEIGRKVNKPSALPVTLRQIFLLRDELAVEDGVGQVAPVTDGQLLDLLAKFRHTECFDPRDKVYALLGVLKEQLRVARRERRVVSVDYNKQTSEVYLEAAWTVLSHNQNLSLLAYVTDSVEIPHLPSWVPDWKGPSDSYLMDTTIANSFKPWRACGDLQWNTRAEIHISPLLKAYGKRIDTIDCVVKYTEQDISALRSILQSLPPVFVFEPRRTSRQYFNHPSSHREDSTKSVLHLPTNSHAITYQTRFEALWRTIINDIWDTGAFVHPAPSMAGVAFVNYLTLQTLKIRAQATAEDTADANLRLAMLNKFGHDEVNCINLIGEYYKHEEPSGVLTEDRMIQYWQMAPKSLEEGMTRLQNQELKDAMNTWREWEHHLFDYDGRKLFTTILGFLGTGPRSAEAGDEVWILGGCDEPCILRMKSNGKYKFVGVAYVHGIMHGEVTKNTDNTKFDEVDLE